MWTTPDKIEEECARVLVRSPELVHLDFNPEGVAEGVLYQDRDDTFRAECAVWNGTSDCFYSKEIGSITQVMLLPL